MKINLYDFDKTIYDGDSSTDFFFFCLKKYPKILKIIPKIVVSAIKYKLKVISKTAMKETIFSFLKYVKDVDKEVNLFWESKKVRIKKFYMETNHDKDIIISASPEFLLHPMCDELNVLDLIGSKVDKKTGSFSGENCHGEEKVRRLNELYKDISVMNAYSDSLSDIPILKLANKSYIVKKNKLLLKKFK